MISKQVLSYYRDCYKEDSAELNLWNVSKLKKDDQLLLSGEDNLGTGFLPRLPIPSDFAQPMLKQVATYQREKVLLYVRYLLVAKLEVNGEVKQVVSPLLFNQAVIEQKGDDYYFSVNKERQEVNETLIQLLMSEDQALPDFSNSEVIQPPSFWTSLLKQSPLNIDVLTLLNFPKLGNANDIKKAIKKNTPTLLPVSMLIFVERSKSSRGILHELGEIINADHLSPPIEACIDARKIQPTNKSLKYDYLPGLLSTPQKKIISISANSHLGCASGPPGTGKSYTIAAVAAEHMARGKSVLIVANQDEALNVIAEKLDQTFGLSDISIRAGQRAFFKKLKAYVADLLAGYFSSDLVNDPQEYELKLNKLNISLNKLEKKFVKYCHLAVRRGQRLKFLDQDNRQWFKRVYLKLVSRGIKKLVNEWDALKDINEQQIEREKLASEYLNALKASNLQTLINSNRQSLDAFNKAIRSRTSQRQRERFNDIDYDSLLSAFPIWLVSLSSLHKVLPLKRTMFDLVIIDEATQCNISSCLPALYRAKRAMVIGDTKQLKHYSFLAKHKEAELMLKNNITENTLGVMSYRDNSILDLTINAIKSNDQIAFLDEHFRSKPELIHFSNMAFYHNRLKVMQHRPSTNSGNLCVRRINGTRDKNGVNCLEADALINEIKSQIERDKKAGIYSSIGVISPFRNQAEYIAKALAGNFTEAEIVQHKLRSSTPFGFQGEERDIMLISFAVDNRAKRAAVYLNKVDVFNVTITRAKAKQILFVSIDENSLPAHYLLRRYLNSIEVFKEQHSITSDVDGFQSSMIKALDKMGIESWPGYAMAGIDIDLLCRYQGQYLAINLIGFPGPWSDFFELNSYKLFKRVGINILPISYGLWVINQGLCLQKVAEYFSIELKNQQEGHNCN